MTRWEELGMTAEEYVRSRWEDGVIESDPERNGVCLWITECGMWFDGPKEAATYTADHEEAIRQKREEIEFMVDGSYPAEAGKVRKRILSVLEGQLAEMLKGWREN